MDYRPPFERQIKDLAIALEALSRISGYGARGVFNDVQLLLEKSIGAMQNWPPKAIEPETLPANKETDDEIPF